MEDFLEEVASACEFSLKGELHCVGKGTREASGQRKQQLQRLAAGRSLPLQALGLQPWPSSRHHPFFPGWGKMHSRSAPWCWAGAPPRLSGQHRGRCQQFAGSDGRAFTLLSKIFS